MIKAMSEAGEEPRRRRILFVGQDRALGAQFRMAGAAANGWTVGWAQTAREARAALEAAAFSAVVAESQLPDMTGMEFLDQVMASQPHVTRILRFRLLITQENLNGVGQSHHLLREPCDAAKLLDFLRQMGALQQRFSNPALPSLMAGMHQLSSPPDLYFQVVEELASPNASVAAAGELIARDPAVTAKLLQLANSAAFGGPARVNQPAEAVSYLGFEMTKAMLLTVHSLSLFETAPAIRPYLEPFWDHALLTGQYAQRIAEWENADQELAGQAFTAGLLHDLGKLLYIANRPDEFAEAMAAARAENRSPWIMEARHLGASHAEAGGFLLAVWNLPPAIVEAVAGHHCPLENRSSPQHFAPLTAVHAADVLAGQARPEPECPIPNAVDLNYLANLGCADHLPDWARLCQPPLAAAA